MWRRDVGYNVRPGVWYSPFVVYDLDGDGKAEIALKASEVATAMGGDGDVNGDGVTDYRETNGDVYYNTHPNAEFLEILEWPDRTDAGARAVDSRRSVGERRQPLQPQSDGDRLSRRQPAERHHHARRKLTRRGARLRLPRWPADAALGLDRDQRRRQLWPQRPGGRHRRRRARRVPVLQRRHRRRRQPRVVEYDGATRRPLSHERHRSRSPRDGDLLHPGVRRDVHPPDLAARRAHGRAAVGTDRGLGRRRARVVGQHQRHHPRHGELGQHRCALRRQGRRTSVPDPTPPTWRSGGTPIASASSSTPPRSRSGTARGLSQPDVGQRLRGGDAQHPDGRRRRARRLARRGLVALQQQHGASRVRQHFRDDVPDVHVHAGPRVPDGRRYDDQRLRAVGTHQLLRRQRHESATDPSARAIRPGI